MRLNNSILGQLADEGVQVPRYDRDDVSTGIVHFGPSNFFRAHLAVYVDDLLNLGHRDLGICAVSLKRPEVRDAIEPQDHLYTVIEQDADTHNTRIIGSVKEMIFAQENKSLVVDRMADPNVKIVSMTITQAGYYYKPSNTGLDDDTLDVDDAEVQYSLEHYDDPTITVGYLVLALEKRMEQGLPPFTVVSCDNLTNNGTILAQTVDAYARRRNPELANWIKENVSFPNTMVDRIVPKTDIRKMHSFAAANHSYHDAWPVYTEPFRQFVIGDLDNPSLAPFADVGVVLTDNVRPYEDMKIRTLNGLHFALGTLGRLSGHKYVDKAIADEDLRDYAIRFMQEVSATLRPVPGINMAEYHEAILKRLENPHMGDELIRLARNGVDKVEGRTLDPLRDAMARGTPYQAILLSFCSWMTYLKRAGQDPSFDISDPKAVEMKLVDTAGSMNGNPSILLANQDIQRMLGSLNNNDDFRREVVDMYSALVHQLEDQGQDGQRNDQAVRLDARRFDV